MPVSTNPEAPAAAPVLGPIRSAAENRRALGEIERLWGSPAGTPAGERLDLLMILVEAYEKEHHPMDPPDPIEAIKFRLDQRGLDRKALEPLVGGRHRVSEIFAGKRRLSLTMIWNIHAGLGVPLESLVQPTVIRATAVRAGAVMTKGALGVRVIEQKSGSGKKGIQLKLGRTSYGIIESKPAGKMRIVKKAGQAGTGARSRPTAAAGGHSAKRAR